MATKTLKKNNVSVKADTPSSVDESVETEVSLTKETESKKREFSQSDLILCRSVTAGKLIVSCRSGNMYEFVEYGSECDIEYKDLVDLARRRSGYIYNPRFIICDDDFLEEFKQIQSVYENMYTIDELKELLVNYPVDSMIESIKKIPEGVYPTIRTLVSTYVANGDIDSVKRIRALSEFFHSDFDLISKLFSE